MKILITVLCVFALLSMVSEADAARVSGVVTLTAEANDNIGVVGVQFQLDGSNLGPEVLSFPFALSWDTTTVSDGPHTLAVIGRDASGNQQASSMIVGVDNTKATVSIISPGGSATVSGSAVTVAASASDAVGVAGLLFQLDGADLTTTNDHVNVAAAANGATATASSFCNSCNNDGISYAPGAAINGDRRGIAWTSGGGWNDATPNVFPDYFEVNFAAARTINEVDVFTLQDDYANPIEPYPGLTFSKYGVTAFQVQYLDGGAWLTVPGGNISGNNQVWRQIVFSPVTTTHVRIYVTGAADAWSRLTEVEVYSSGADIGEIKSVPYSVSWDSTTVSNGSHTLTAIAFDTAGNQTTATTTITVNNNGGSVSPGTLAKSGPANTSTGLSVNPTLSWGTSGGATSYEYCIDTVNNNSCDTSWTSTTNTSAATGGLNPGATYYWQVRARSSGGATEADNGAWWSFTVSSGGQVNAAAASNGAKATASSTFNAGYAPGGAINGDRRGTSWGSGGGWNDGTAGAFPDWLQVDFAGPQTIGEVDVFTVQDNYINPIDPFLGLTFSQYGITDFQIQFWDGFSWVIVPGGNISGNNQVWRQISFAPVTTSRIRVLVTGALNSWSRITEVEAYSNFGSVGVSPGPLAKSGPSNGGVGPSVNPTLNWGASSGATSYEYCIDTINNNSCDAAWTSTTSTSAVVSGLSAGTSYFWQVRARNSSGTTDADIGAWWNFSTSPGGPVNVASAASGATASASSSYNANYPPAGAIDGDRKGLAWGNGGGWNDATPDLYPDWIQINFAGAKSISEIDVFTVQDNYNAPLDPTPAMTFSQYGVTNFDVQYWDGANWVDVPNGSINGNTLVWQKINFPALTTTSIRIVVTGALNTYSRITEVEAY